ncbi:right-handed parallel beta-helix repeat-containing protein [Ruficoccus amylovorans]|uniref:Right-handed parallel beta-helix repeat-containing protein n=1 Tax=Ruficoccus amylovorans TaxID=1804625 RepID=A0A842HK87_9BACT|nr:right-handed parallel beta-helix repeat-containing protein [Ruficoccus amylovorans]MBC2595571.1 right-handed parallel beta-helix repeat-containing protein [Ruficoccus amylovorans]
MPRPDKAIHLTPPPVGTDASALIADAIHQCAHTGTSLHLTPGNYHLYPTERPERYLHVTNHDDGLRILPIPLEGIKDLTISGPGARLIAHGQPVIPLSLHHCENIIFEGISIDWDVPLHMQGTIIAVDEAADTITVKFSDPENLYLHQGCLLHGEGGPPPGNLTPYSVTPGKEWWQDIHWTHWLDAASATPLPLSRQGNFLTWNPQHQQAPRFEKLASDTYRITHLTDRPQQVGDAFVSKGKYMPNRMSPAIFMDNCCDIRFHDVTIHHAGGMGLIAQRCENVRIKRMRVARPECSGRLISTTADATHFVLCKGLIEVTDSHFEHMLDDALNVHGISATVREATASHTLRGELMHFQQLGLEFARPGETIRFSTRDDLVAYGERTVKSFRALNSRVFELELTESVADLLRPNSFMENTSCAPDVIFTGNTVRNNRARSIIFTTEGRVRIENNRFENCTMTAILIEGDANSWFECGPVRDVLIRNNDFVMLSPEAPAITISPNERGLPMLSETPYHCNIRITGNRFRMPGPRVLRGNRIEGLVFENNTVTALPGYSTEPDCPSLSLGRSSGIQICNNSFDLPHAVIFEGCAQS